MTEIQDSFASVKKRWREDSTHLKISYPGHLANTEGALRLEECADELECGLERRVRELRDDCLKKVVFCESQHNFEDCHCGTAYKVMADKLTALLGDKSE